MGRVIGTRVVLREYRWEDLADIRAWITDGEITRHLSGTFLKPQSWEQTEDFLRRQLNGDMGGACFVIAEKETLKYIGQCDLMRVDSIAHKAELAIVIGGDWVNRGYGTEAVQLLLKYAFEQMNLHRVWLKVYADNPRAIRAYEKAGFSREGVLREDLYRDGAYMDVLVMGILRKEWEKHV